MSTRAIFAGQAAGFVFPSSLGTNGQVLESDGTAVVWGAGGGGGSSFVDITVSGELSRTVDAVTQITSITTDVTVNSPCGVITCFDVTATPIASGDTVQFTVTNPLVSVNDLVLVSVQGHYNVAAGIPLANVHQVQDGSFKIRLSNAGLVALTGQVVVGFEIVRAI